MFLFSFRGLLVSVFSSWLYPVLAALLVFMISAEDRPLYLAILASLSLLASVILFKRLRTLSDTGTTSLRTVAQGYVELMGTAMTFSGETGPGPFYLPPTVWFCTVNQRSVDGFLVEDEHGSCTVDPQKAEVITPLFHRQHWYRAIHPGETVYILGQLTTLSRHYTDTDKRKATLHLLSDWKKDSVEMLHRFDKNGDGKIDQQELMVARQAAEVVVDNNHDHEYRLAATHVIGTTNDSRPFIVSSIPIEKLLKRYNAFMMSHLIAWPLLTVVALLFS